MDKDVYFDGFDGCDPHEGTASVNDLHQRHGSIESFNEIAFQTSPASSYEAVGQMVHDKASGSTFAEIASARHCSLSTVRRRVISAVENRSFYPINNRKHHPDRADEIISKTLNAHPHTTSIELVPILSQAGVALSESAVRRRCIALGYIFRRNHYGFSVRVQNRLPRVAFCTKLLEHPEICKDAVFLDECTIEIFESGPGRYLKGSDMTRCPKPKHPLSMNMLGGCSRRGGTELVMWKGSHRMNSDFFVEHYVKPVLAPFKNNVFMGRCSVIMDNSPIHCAKTTLSALTDCGLHVVEWPAESPDLNPIETTWSHMKHFVAKIQPKSELELVSAVTSFWSKHVTPQYCRNQIERIPTIAKKVIEHSGGPVYSV